MKPLQRYIAVLAVFALTAGALPAGAAERPDKEGVNVAEFTIAGHRFRIPKAYLTQKADMAGRVLDDYGDAVIMEGLMPEIRPIVTKRDKKFYRGGKALEETVDFSIWSRPGQGGMLKDYYESEYRKQCTKIDKDSLVCPELSLFATRKYTEILVKKRNQREYVFRCTKIGTSYNTFCRTRLPLIDKLELRISFGRKYLDEAERIITRAYSIICGYWDSDPSRTLTTNHCK